MLDAAGFRDLVSGRRQGFPAAALRGMLRLAEIPYTWVVRRRNRGFETGRRAAISVSVPVISVGNLTLGGTGKTPLVEWIARWFLQRDVQLALVSRGYGSNSGSANDEARELAQKLPGVPHVQNPDRVAAAKMAIDQFGSQVIVLDDGFQHRRIARNLDIVLIDALEPFGFGHVFPRGTLREPVEGLQRADVVVLSRADMANAMSRQKIRDVVQKLAPRSVWAECQHAAVKLISVDGIAEPISHLAGKSVAAFCGIGNPAGFRHTLEACGCDIAAWRNSQTITPMALTIWRSFLVGPAPPKSSLPFARIKIS